MATSHKIRRGTAIVVTPKGFLVVSSDSKIFMLPGGHARRGESRRSAAIRELREETGLVASSCSFLFEHTSTHYYHKVFLITASGEAKPHMEIKHIAYFDGDNIPLYGSSRNIIEHYKNLHMQAPNAEKHQNLSPEMDKRFRKHAPFLGGLFNTSRARGSFNLIGIIRNPIVWYSLWILLLIYIFSTPINAHGWFTPMISYPLFAISTFLGFYPAYRAMRAIDRMHLGSDLQIWGMRLLAGLTILGGFFFGLTAFSFSWTTAMMKSPYGEGYLLVYFAYALALGLIIASGFMLFRYRRRAGIIVFNR